MLGAKSLAAGMGGGQYRGNHKRMNGLTWSDGIVVKFLRPRVETATTDII